MRQKNQVAQAIIFELKAINNSKDIRLVNGNEKMKMAEESYKRELKSEKSKKWNWGAFGIIIGGAIGFLTAISL